MPIRRDPQGHAIDLRPPRSLFNGLHSEVVRSRFYIQCDYIGNDPGFSIYPQYYSFCCFEYRIAFCIVENGTPVYPNISAISRQCGSGKSVVDLHARAVAQSSKCGGIGRIIQRFGEKCRYIDLSGSLAYNLFGNERPPQVAHFGRHFRGQYGVIKNAIGRAGHLAKYDFHAFSQSRIYPVFPRSAILNRKDGASQKNTQSPHGHRRFGSFSDLFAFLIALG